MFETVSYELLLKFYLLHFFISAVISYVSSLYLKKRYKDNFKSLFLLILSFNVVVPFIGYAFTFWMSYYLMKIKYAKTLKNAKSLNMQELDNEFPTVKRMFGEGSMVELMKDETAPKFKRMKALSTMAEDMNRRNISLIKQSLSDKDDEIRLFSFSLIDNMEQDINTKIHEASLNFEKAENTDDKVKYAKELAYLYWDMVYFDLLDDTLKNFFINESLKYAKIVFKEDLSDSSMNILLGKIYILRDEYEEASTQFIMAIESGADNEYVVPYLAEIYFERGNYKSIRSMLNLVKSLGINSTMYPVVAQWSSDE